VGKSYSHLGNSNLLSNKAIATRRLQRLFNSNWIEKSFNRIEEELEHILRFEDACLFQNSEVASRTQLQSLWHHLTKQFLVQHTDFLGIKRKNDIYEALQSIAKTSFKRNKLGYSHCHYWPSCIGSVALGSSYENICPPYSKIKLLSSYHFLYGLQCAVLPDWGQNTFNLLVLSLFFSIINHYWKPYLKIKEQGEYTFTYLSTEFGDSNSCDFQD